MRPRGDSGSDDTILESPETPQSRSVTQRDQGRHEHRRDLYTDRGYHALDARQASASHELGYMGISLYNELQWFDDRDRQNDFVLEIETLDSSATKY